MARCSIHSAGALRVLNQPLPPCFSHCVVLQSVPNGAAKLLEKKGGHNGRSFLPVTCPKVAVIGAEASGPHSFGIPALRRPVKYVASTKARIFGTPKYTMALRRAMLE